MKLNFGKRLVLFLHWLMSVLLVLVFLFPDLAGRMLSVVNTVIGAGVAKILTIAVLVLYALFAVLSLVFIFSRDKNRKERGLITVDASESGKTRVSVAAVEQMIRQAVRGVDGIAEMKLSIRNEQDAISINANVTLLTGAHVPTVTMNMQRAIRGYIELNCGVSVREICVNVNSVESAADGKRSSKKNQTAAPVMPVEQIAEPEPQVIEPEMAAEPAQEEALAEETAEAEE